jgi:hypothetical protein
MGLAERAVQGVRRTQSLDVARGDSADDESRRSLRRLQRDLYLVNACARRTCATPRQHSLDSYVLTLKDNLHATVREVACRPEHSGEHCLATYAVAKVNALHEPRNKQSTPNDFTHITSLGSPSRRIRQPCNRSPEFVLSILILVGGDSQICIALTSARRAKAPKNDVNVNEAITMTLCDGDVEGLFAGR